MIAEGPRRVSTGMWGLGESSACAQPPHVGRLLGAYVLGSLGRRDVRAVDRHLRECPLCSEERVRLSALPRLLDSSIHGRPKGS